MKCDTLWSEDEKSAMAMTERASATIEHKCIKVKMQRAMSATTEHINQQQRSKCTQCISLSLCTQ